MSLFYNRGCNFKTYVGCLRAGLLLRRFATTNSEHQKKDSQAAQHLVEYFGSTSDIEWKTLYACRTIEKLMAIEAIYIYIYIYI